MFNTTAKIASKVIESFPLPGLRLFTVHTGTKGMISLHGSLFGGYSMSPTHNPMLSSVMVRMLDQGTEKQSKHKIHETLESLGAELEFGLDTYRVRFEGKCLSEHLPVLLTLLGEQLKHPRFGEKELAVVKRHMITDLEHEKDDTGAEAYTSFKRHLFPPQHPNYRITPDEKISFIERITTQELKTFHFHSLGLGSLTVVLSGDVSQEIRTKLLASTFRDWHESALAMPSVRAVPLPQKKGTTFKTMPDKTSVDVFMGGSLFISNTHPDFYSLLLAAFTLGGPNFSSRLMSTVREKQGLTYGIYSKLGGVNFGDFGYWYITASFAPSNVTKGLKAIGVELGKFISKGISAEELKAKKETLTGLYKVSLATSEALGGAVLANAEMGRDIAFLDTYPDIIHDLKRETVNRVIKEHYKLDTITLSAAGTIDGEGQPIASL